MKSLGMRGADKVKVPQPSNKPKLPPSPYLAFMSAMYKLSPEEQRAKLGAELKGAAAKNTTFLRKKFEELPESEKKVASRKASFLFQLINRLRHFRNTWMLAKRRWRRIARKWPSTRKRAALIG